MRSDSEDLQVAANKYSAETTTMLIVFVEDSAIISARGPVTAGSLFVAYTHSRVGEGISNLQDGAHRDAEPAFFRSVRFGGGVFSEPFANASYF